MKINTDVLIVGGGIAGMSLGLHLNTLRPDINILMITKEEFGEGNTKYAQGGFSSVLSETDSFKAHIEDSLVAGAGLCHKDVVEEIIRKAPDAIKQLMEWGVEFDRDKSNNIELGREGGHHIRRIAHVKDYTGLAIQQALMHQIRKRDAIELREKWIAIDLVYVEDQIAGCYVFQEEENRVISISARVTILATGGAGKVFRYTSNPDVAVGDGIAMAYRAGAVISNMEFIQFHPTILFHPEFRTFLISEAVRGEGAILKTMDGRKFMQGLHELADLAPRDIVSRAIDREIKRSGDDHILLDITFKDPEFVKNRFPGIYGTLIEHGIDMTSEPIPVVPAAHYTVGGVKAEVDGRTNLKGLFAIGETACTGLHGANRLASNSLLEASVMGKQSAYYLADHIDDYKNYEFKDWQVGDAVEPDEAIIISHNWAELRRLMWNYVGIVRTTKRLLRALTRIEVLKEEINEYYWDFHVTRDIIELRNVVQVAELIIKSALERKESRGAHYTSDYPQQLSELQDTCIRRDVGVYFSKPLDKVD